MLIKSYNNQFQNSCRHNKCDQQTKSNFYNKLHAGKMKQLIKFKIASVSPAETQCTTYAAVHYVTAKSAAACSSGGAGHRSRACFGGKQTRIDRKTNGHLTLVFTSVNVKDVIKAVQYVNKLLMNLSCWFMTRNFKNQHQYLSDYKISACCPSEKTGSETTTSLRNRCIETDLSSCFSFSSRAVSSETITDRSRGASAAALRRRRSSETGHCFVDPKKTDAADRAGIDESTADTIKLLNNQKTYGPFCFDAHASKHKYVRVFSDCAQQFGAKNITKTLQKAVQSTSIFTVVRAAFVFKKTREQFGITNNCYYIKIAIQSKAQQNMLLQCLSLLKLVAEVKVISYY